LKPADRVVRIGPAISLRISPVTPDKGKRYGKGCAGFLSRLPVAAIDGEERIEKRLSRFRRRKQRENPPMHGIAREKHNQFSSVFI
jgi:hypothetical protein